MKASKEALLLQNQLCFPLYASSRLTTKLYAPYLEELGLTYPQYLVMLVLWEADGQRVNDIARRLHLETNTVTPLLKRLEQKALLQRRPSKTDERSVEIHLSESGRKLQFQAMEVPAKIVKAFEGSGLKQEEVLQLQESLFKILAALNKHSNKF